MGTMPLIIELNSIYSSAQLHIMDMNMMMGLGHFSALTVVSIEIKIIK